MVIFGVRRCTIQRWLSNELDIFFLFNTYKQDQNEQFPSTFSVIQEDLNKEIRLVLVWSDNFFINFLGWKESNFELGMAIWPIKPGSPRPWPGWAGDSPFKMGMGTGIGENFFPRSGDKDCSVSSPLGPYEKLKISN